MNRQEKLQKLRKLMEEKGIDAYLVESSDPHFTEYKSQEHRDVMWLTGFSGSAGFGLVTKDKALLWTDGRYFIQAENELDGTEFELMKMATPGYPDIYGYVSEILESGTTLGINPYSTSITEYEKLKEAAGYNDIKVIDDWDLVSQIWADKPVKDIKPGFGHELKYAGKTPSEKLEAIREEMVVDDIDLKIMTALDDIAWTFNIRGYDITNNPYVTSYGVITQNVAMIFIPKDRLDEALKDHFEENDIIVRDYGQFDEYLRGINNKNVYMDEGKTSRNTEKLLENNNIYNGPSIVSQLKAIKNDEEIKNQKNAYIKDGVVLTEFIHWIKTHPDISSETETTVREKLDKMRSQQDLYIMPSFDTISAYGKNAAMMHYNDSDEGEQLQTSSFYLVDSGGQYLDGTTDITRTIALGDLTKEEITDFTLVVEAVFSLSETIFLEGSSGHSLDAIARRPLWKHMMDYKCGTGHGVGYCLGVHEGPQNISRKPIDVPLMPGMITSIEPGVYKEDKHGIRTENITLITEAGESSDGRFFQFENISFAPIDLDAIDPGQLSEESRRDLNRYHKKVYENLKDLVKEDTKTWLKEVTREI